MENPLKMDDLGVALFLETPIFETVLEHNSEMPPEIIYPPSKSDHQNMIACFFSQSS